MGEQDPNEHPKEHANQKWYDYKPTKLGKALAYVAVYAFFILIDYIEVWHFSHFWWTFAFIVATIALLYAEVFAGSDVSRCLWATNEKENHGCRGTGLP
jgi:hypothetical protein